MNIIEVRNLNKFFYHPCENHILKNIDMNISKGKLTSITGKSGSGKSTLLYLLSTMDTNFEGSIKIEGVELNGKDNKWLAEFRNKHLGFIFQFHFLLPEFSVLNNVMLPALKLGALEKEEIEVNAIELLNFLGISDQYNKKAALLSGGQQQRVAIARALINKPSIIIGDEPTGNLDSYNTSLVIELFKELAQMQGQTLLMVTHDEDFAANSDIVIHLSDGRIL
ncbi:ATP-binding protein [Porphyromonas macacae]|uniref:ATP-binding protein n=1 Tax=Porphyromonas macacae TaxID=28115 RepID=A0A0A2EJA0_9PORP|nr:MULTISPECIES: ABC transporter ATP-binding protein [Porphyromonas]ATR99615.1 ABC transporter ATP-binding protein [Porphyromonas gingivalis]KGN76444.1 ATP-binding protein [Porphyromonas macacae]SJL26837.1 ABC transporter ATP-binding protein [Porphyromonas gingivalis]